MLFVMMLCALCTKTHAQSFTTSVKTQYINAIGTGGYTTDTLFTTTAGKHDYAAFEAFGNAGEYAEVRMYSGSTTYGTFRVYGGHRIQIPKADNYVSVLPNFDINLGTLTSFTNEKGVAVQPFVYCIAFTK